MGCPETVTLNNGYETLWPKAMPTYLALIQLDDQGPEAVPTRDYLVEVAQGQTPELTYEIAACLRRIGVQEIDEISRNVVLSSIDERGQVQRPYGKKNWHMTSQFRNHQPA